MAELFQLGLAMLTAGAVAIVLAQHSVKGTQKNPWTMTPECVFRGSGDILANLAAAHGIYQLDSRDKDRTLIHVECVKPRDFEPWGPFQLEGKPWINKEGDFRCVANRSAPVGSGFADCEWFYIEKKAFNDGLKANEPEPKEDTRLAIILEKQKDAAITLKDIAKDMGISVRTVKYILAKKKKADEEAQNEAEPLLELGGGDDE
jgi:hypothetical protein